jgi:hypothetical protein
VYPAQVERLSAHGADSSVSFLFAGIVWRTVKRYAGIRLKMAKTQGEEIPRCQTERRYTVEVSKATLRALVVAFSVMALS